MTLEIGLFEVLEGGGARLVGRLSDPDLVETARDRLASAQRRALARLESPVRLVADPDDGAGE
jgi:hypothetical protein